MRIKETGSRHWDLSGYGFIPGTNETGFTALPGGSRSGKSFPFSDFFNIGYYGYWWTSTEGSLEHAFNRTLDWAGTLYSCCEVDSKPCDGWGRQYCTDKNLGHSVRCVKD